jgi:hypothetical protein
MCKISVKQALYKMRTDESSAAGDENSFLIEFHIIPLNYDDSLVEIAIGKP